MIIGCNAPGRVAGQCSAHRLGMSRGVTNLAGLLSRLSTSTTAKNRPRPEGRRRRRFPLHNEGWSLQANRTRHPISTAQPARAPPPMTSFAGASIERSAAVVAKSATVSKWIEEGRVGRGRVGRMNRAKENAQLTSDDGNNESARLASGPQET